MRAAHCLVLPLLPPLICRRGTQSTPGLSGAVARLFEGAGLPPRSLAQLALALIGGVLQNAAPMRLRGLGRRPSWLLGLMLKDKGVAALAEDRQVSGLAIMAMRTSTRHVDV